jgi:hypothetical protein
MSTHLTKAQDHSPLIGKTYSALVSTTCKTMPEGGCTLYTFCIMQFKAGAVQVYYSATASCTDKQKEAGYTHNNKQDHTNYKWHMNKQTIIIEGFDEFAPFTFNGSLLTGTKKMNAKTEPIEFKEVVE